MQIVQKIVAGSLLFTVIAISLLSLSEYIGQFNHLCELMGHLKLLWLVLLLILLFVSVVLRKQLSIIIAGAALVIAVVPIVALYVPEYPQREHSKNTVRFLEMNLWGGKNHDYQRAFQSIRQQNPDIFGLTEITGPWLEKLKLEFTDYPYVIAEPGHGGIAIFSRIPLEGEVRYFGSIQRPRIYSKIQLAQETVFVFAHPVIPPVLYKLRNAELEQLAQEAKHTTGPVILAGDLNCTPWSYYFRKLLSSSGLKDTEQGFGPQPSWNQFFYFPILPIDHCLVSQEFNTIGRRPLAPFGSDHLPIVVDLALHVEREHLKIK